MSGRRVSNLADADADADATAVRDTPVAHKSSQDHIELLTNAWATKGSVEVALDSGLTDAGPDDTVILCSGPATGSRPG
ncbi:hypothetical protein [Sphingomonas sp.]|uniref:hypothetical protein n=1 Tax=Sphingomonas sp. TaxID=28214 RepID=UPI003AFF9A23